MATVCWARPARHTRTVLPNGLVVLAVQDDSTPVSAFHLGVRFGLQVSDTNRPGVAAVAQQVAQLRLEALLEQPEWARLQEQVEGRSTLQLNTENSYCEARGSVLDNQLEAALRLGGQALLGREAGSAGQFDAARRILDEAATDSDRKPGEVAYHRFLRRFYPTDSLLAYPVWGRPGDLGKLTAEDVARFAATYLGPNNASLCLVGPRSPEELTALATRVFGRYTASSETLKREMQVGRGASGVAVAEVPGWRGASVLAGVPVPDYGSRGFIMAQLVFEMISGPEGRLISDPDAGALLGLNRPFQKARASNPVTVLPPTASLRPYLLGHAVCQPRQMELARQIILGHLLAFAAAPPGDVELGAAKRRLLNASALSQLSRGGLVKAWNSYELCGSDAEAYWQFERDVVAVKAPEIQAMAREWFSWHAIGVALPGLARGAEELPED